VLAPGDDVEDDALLFVLRGKARVSILGIPIREIKAGETIGQLKYLGLPALPSRAEIVAVTAMDVVSVPRQPMLEALEDERYEDDVVRFKDAQKVLNGGEVTDKFGFPTGGGGVFATDCIEKSEVLCACDAPFVAQIGQLVEDFIFWPGEKLFEQGGVGEWMYFIQAGRVRMEVLGMKTVEYVDAYGTIGDLAVLGQVSAHTATAIADTYTWARALHRNLINRALASFPSEERRLRGAAESGTVGLFDDE
jgi:CRP-like cAMP-binding protein